MSTLHHGSRRTEREPPSGLRMTAEEFFALGETDRCELVDGVVLMSPSPTPRHQLVFYLLLRQIGVWLDTEIAGAVFPDTDIWFDESHVYRPDIAVYRAGRVAPVPVRLNVPPDLIIEVLSPGSKMMDLITKREDYERFGVGEYWVVDPTPPDARIHCWRRSGDRFTESREHSDVVACASIPNASLDLNPLRELVRRSNP